MAGRRIVLNSNNDPDTDKDMVQHLLGMPDIQTVAGSILWSGKTFFCGDWS